MGVVYEASITHLGKQAVRGRPAATASCQNPPCTPKKAAYRNLVVVDANAKTGGLRRPLRRRGRRRADGDGRRAEGARIHGRRGPVGGWRTIFTGVPVRRSNLDSL